MPSCNPASKAIQRTLWFSNESDRESLVHKGVLPLKPISVMPPNPHSSAESGKGSPVGPREAASAAECCELLTSLSQVKDVIGSLPECFDASLSSSTAKPRQEAEMVWLDLMDPSEKEMREVIACLAPSFPHLRFATRHWFATEERHSSDKAPIVPFNEDSSRTDSVEYFPAYGYGLLRFTAMMNVECSSAQLARKEAWLATVNGSKPTALSQNFAEAGKELEVSMSSSSERLASEMSDEQLRCQAFINSENGGREAPLMVVSAILFDHAMITFRKGYFNDEKILNYQLMRCFGASMSFVASPLSPDFTSFSGLSKKGRGGHRSAQMMRGLVLSTIIGAVVEELKRATAPLLMETNMVDELALSIRPSAEDHKDVLRRMESIRHRLHLAHVQLLRKESLLQQLIATARENARANEREEGAKQQNSTKSIGSTKTTMDDEVITRYLHSLSLVRAGVASVRRGRDTVNLASMNVVSGVVARLGKHCHKMDYLNKLQTQIALLVMPINVIPGLMSGNFKVPFEDSEHTFIFWIFVGVTVGTLIIGLSYPFYQSFRYRLPGSIAPL